MLYEEAAVLVPGFFGFGRFGNFSYFADRVAAALRSSLQARVGRPVPVLSIASDPAGGLAARQRFLLTQLGRIDALLGGIRAFHLIGHSTGGLDAELLTRAHPVIERARWDDLDPRKTRRRIASITSISAPHYGTYLADADAAAAFASPIAHVAGLIEAGGLVWDGLKLLADRVVTVAALEGAAFSGLTTTGFLARFLFHQRLIADLRPSNIEAIRAENPREILAPVASFVVVAPRPSAAVYPARRPDDLFRRLHALTAGTPGAPSSIEERTIFEIRRHWHQAIRNPAIHLRELDPSDNDGVVNTARQLLLPSRGDDAYLGGIVVADHADVIGHYDREDPLSFDWRGRSKPINEGFFRSGAAFGDDQFFELYTRVADCVCRALERPVRPRATGRLAVSDARLTEEA